MLSTLLRNTNWHKATDPRDRVFGLLALAQPGRHVPFLPDYELSTADTYIKVAKHLIQDDGHLQILSDAQVRQHVNDVPSWVPDWEGDLYTMPLAACNRDSVPKHLIHGSFKPQDFLLPCADPRKLKLRAACLGKIALIVSLESFVRILDQIKQTNWSKLLEAVQDFYIPFIQYSLHLQETYATTGEPMATAVLKTLAADDLPCSHRGTLSDRKITFPSYSEFESLTWREAIYPIPFDAAMMGDSPYAEIVGGPAQEVENFVLGTGQLTQWRTTKMQSSRLKSKTETVYLTIATEIARAIRVPCKGRAIFVTDTGYLGLGPLSSEAGDEVYDLLGCDVPFVLHKTEVEDELQLAGDCYIHGVMDGQLRRASNNQTGLEAVDGKLEWKGITLV